MLLDTGFISTPATQKASLRHEADALAEHFYFYRKPLAMHQICGAVVAAVSAAVGDTTAVHSPKVSCEKNSLMMDQVSVLRAGGLSRDPESG